jgi:DNA-binding transcriptional ArsR family regulator
MRPAPPRVCASVRRLSNKGADSEASRSREARWSSCSRYRKRLEYWGEMASSQGSDPSVRPWRLLSAHGFVLFYISLRPGCTVTEISDGVSLAPRSVYGTLGDLRRAGMIDVRKDGRRHYYSVNYGARVGLSVMSGGTELRHMLRFLANRTLRLLSVHEGLTVADRPSSEQLRPATGPLNSAPLNPRTRP